MPPRYLTCRLWTQSFNCYSVLTALHNFTLLCQNYWRINKLPSPLPVTTGRYFGTGSHPRCHKLLSSLLIWCTPGQESLWIIFILPPGGHLTLNPPARKLQGITRQSSGLSESRSEEPHCLLMKTEAPEPPQVTKAPENLLLQCCLWCLPPGFNLGASIPVYKR